MTSQISTHFVRIAIATATTACLLSVTATAGARRDGPFDTCAGEPATIVGTNADSGVRATTERDVIQAAGGNDEIDARSGDDLVCLGAGHDHGFLGHGADVGFGGGGRDVISGSQDADRIAGGGGDDRLFGTEVLVTGPAPGPTDNDVLLGGPGNDHIHAGPGRDRVHCGPGQDIAFADRNDRVAKDCEKVHPAG